MQRLTKIVFIAIMAIVTIGGCSLEQAIAAKSEDNFYVGYRDFSDLSKSLLPQGSVNDSFYLQFNFLKKQTCHFLYGFDIGGSWFKVNLQDTYKGGYYIDAGFPLVFRILPKRVKMDLFISPGGYYVNAKIDETVGARVNTGVTLRYFINKTNSFGITGFYTFSTKDLNGFNMGVSYGF
jgi:hypothetical protein